MCRYKIISINKTNIDDETYRVLITNKYDDSDKKLLQLTPHAGTSASGFLIDEKNDAVIPLSCFVLKPSLEKELNSWATGDLVDIDFHTKI